MAVKTKAAILAEIASLLADNTTGDISASDVRTCLNDIVDSYGEVLEATGTFSAAQINDMGSTPVVIIPAQGTDKLILIEKFIGIRKAGTAYTTIGALIMRYTNGDDFDTIVDNSMLTGTDFYWNQGGGNQYSFGMYAGNVNSSFEVICDQTISGGTGEIDYYVKYRVIDVS